MGTTKKATEQNTEMESEVKNVKTIKKVEPLKNEDEIVVVSNISNVSYFDSKNNDHYIWEKAGHEEMMTVATLKDMWRNSKKYFKDMWLKPMDERVIASFGLTKAYTTYEFLFDSKSYTKANLSKIKGSLLSLPVGLKETLIRKIQMNIVNGEITDAQVIKSLELLLKIDLFHLLG